MERRLCALVREPCALMQSLYLRVAAGRNVGQRIPAHHGAQRFESNGGTSIYGKPHRCNGFGKRVDSYFECALPASHTTFVFLVSRASRA